MSIELEDWECAECGGSGKMFADCNRCDAAGWVWRYMKKEIANE